VNDRSSILVRRFRQLAALAGCVAALLCALAVLGVSAPEARAAASDWTRNDQGELRLISATRGVGDDAALRLGLQFRMAEGWKIYWRSPGDAGFPPSIDWSGSDNLADAELRWPVPHRFQLFGLQTFGYGGEVVLPIDARAEDPTQPVRLNAEVNYLTCEEICVPHTVTLAMTLPPGAAQPSNQAFAIDRFRSQVPGEGAGAGLDLTRAALVADGESPVLELAVAADPALDNPDAVVEGLRGVSFGKPEVTLQDGGSRAVLRLQGSRGPSAEGPLAGKTATITVFDGKRGLERTLTLGEELSGSAGAAPGLRWTGGSVPPGELLGILGLAVLGGLILNLMPCVLPVLSLKLLSVVDQGGRARRQVRASFLASAAGILFSFLVLAAGAAALKAAGLAVGWGVQFQQPLFLVALVLVLALFALNLFGAFEIRLPGRLNDAIAGAGAPAQPGQQAHGGHLGGHFLTGAFATLLATPCSAPFLGTAVGFALSRGLAEILAIFLALGIGLALPYLLVAAVPGLAAALPRPGRWMIWLRRVLGLALLGTAAWLLSVLAAEDGLLAAAAVAGLTLAAMAVLALRPTLGPGLRRAAPLAVLLLAVGAFAAPPGLGSGAPQRSQPAESDWRDLDRAAIDRLVADGKLVFVDVTADWCITCQVNKAAVIDADAVQQRLQRDDVVRMRGDWTRPSQRITDYLASYGRYGIPFNAVYGPGAPEGIVLPELLSRSGVLEALDRARAAGGDAQTAKAEP
jgi:suppressor for copper-sensitivity B